MAALAAVACVALAPAAFAAGPGATPQTAAATVTQLRADPASDTLGSTTSPEDDLRSALARLAAAPDDEAAGVARRLGIDILEGNPVPGKAYSGIPLLNWNAPAKVRDVPAGGTVTVNEVRFGEHVLTDTWLLRFADPAQPFSIRWRVTDLTDSPGELSPSPLLTDGTGRQAAVVPLVVPPTPTGRSLSNRFQADAPEMTRTVTQESTVAMPAPGQLSAVLDPNRTPGHLGMATLLPATPDRLAAAAAAFGFSGDAPTPAEKAAAIGAIGAAAPEKMLWADLKALDPADVTAAHALGTQDAPLVAAMLTHVQTPAGLTTAPAPATAGPSVQVTLLNDEAYLSTSAVNLPPGSPLTVTVTNADGFGHTFAATDLHDRTPVHGALDWGAFRTATLALGAPGTLPPGASRTFSLRPSPTSFGLVLGDPDLGDQSAAFLPVDRGPARQTVALGPSWSAPGHSAADARGDVWVALEGADAVARVSPAADLSASKIDLFPLPNSGNALTMPPAVLHPHDVVVDGRGIVWVTLADGNGITRIDPAKVAPGTSDGITTLALAPCNVGLVCPPAPPPVPPPPVPAPPSRIPAQMATMIDGAGNTVLWYSEMGADGIGVMRVSPTGTLLDKTDFPCNCGEPKGLALAADGAVWFTSGLSNAIGRLTPDPGRLTASATVDLFQVPSAIPMAVVGVNGLTMVATSGPHSVAVDHRGRVWFTEEETGKVGWLEPAAAVPGTGFGMHELAAPVNDFGVLGAPADLVVDRADRVFVVDEYGDMVFSVTTAGVADKWRPLFRASLTDKPILLPGGDLLFAEAGAGSLSRISGVSAGALPPALPPVLTADAAAGLVTGTGLRDTTSVDVEITRNGALVSSTRGLAVTGGSFTTPGAAGMVRSGDLVNVIPHGPVPLPVLSLRVATLDAAVDGNASLSGHGTVDGRPVESVIVDIGAGPMTATAGGTDGAFVLPTATRLDPATTHGRLTSTGATPAAQLRTIVPFGPTPPAPAASQSPAPSAVPVPARSPAGAGVTGGPPVPASPPAAASAHPARRAARTSGPQRSSAGSGSAAALVPVRSVTRSHLDPADLEQSGSARSVEQSAPAEQVAAPAAVEASGPDRSEAAERRPAHGGRRWVLWAGGIVAAVLLAGALAVVGLVLVAPVEIERGRLG